MIKNITSQWIWQGRCSLSPIRLRRRIYTYFSSFLKTMLTDDSISPEFNKISHWFLLCTFETSWQIAASALLSGIFETFDNLLWKLNYNATCIRYLQDHWLSSASLLKGFDKADAVPALSAASTLICHHFLKTMLTDDSLSLIFDYHQKFLFSVLIPGKVHPSHGAQSWQMAALALLTTFLVV